MNHTDAIEMMLKNLDNWRHLPKYQLERRADMFIGLFIKQIVAAHLKNKVHDLLLPEFPFKHNKEGADTKHTVNFDYVLFSKDLDKMYIVELKTDSDSYRADQAKYLEDAAKVGFEKIISGINEVMDATSKSKRRKYDYLRGLLAKEGLVTENGELVALKNPEVQLLYLGPKPNNKDIADKLEKDGTLIEMNDAADFLEKTGGALECHFAAYLRRWSQVPAGSICCE